MSSAKGAPVQDRLESPNPTTVGPRKRQLEEMSTLSSQVAAPAVSLEAPTKEAPEMVIRPRKGWIAIDWAELWRHRELLYFLVWRDVKVRYKQALLGFAWAILAPVITVAIFTFIFGRA